MTRIRMDTSNPTTSLSASKAELRADEVNESLLRGLAASDQLKILKIAPCSFDERSRMALLDLIPTLTSLEEITLSLDSFGVEGISDLAKSLLTNGCIENVNGIELFSFREESEVYSIDLSDTSLTPSDVRLVAELVKTNSTVIEIKLEQSFLPIKEIRSGVKNGAILLTGRPLRTLDLHFIKATVPCGCKLSLIEASNCAINDEGAKVFAAWMPQICAVEVDLSHNDLSHAGCLEIVKAAGTSGLSVLDVRGNNLLTTKSELHDMTVAFRAAKKLTSINGFALRSLHEAVNFFEIHLAGNGIDWGFAALLISLVGSLDKLKSLSITEVQLGENLDVFTSTLCNSLERCENLEHICLAGNNLPDKFASALGEAFSLFQVRVRSLDLSANCFGKGAVDVATALASSKLLRTLNLRGNAINEARAKRIMTCLLKVDSLEEVNRIRLNGGEDARQCVQFDGFDYLSIAAALCHKSQTTKLVIAGSQVNCAKTAFIGRLIRGSFLEVLDLSHNSIGTDGVRAIVDGIASAKGLKHLNLSHNHLKDTAISELAQGLLTSSIETLNISRNDFGSDGASSLAAAFGEGSSLKTLDLSGNAVGDKGLSSICSAIPSTQIETLKAREIDVSSLKCLSSVLKNESSLKVLDLSRNGLGSSCAHIAEALKSNTSLAHLTLQENRIGDTISSLLAQALSRNKGLKKLNLRYNRIKDKGAQAIAKSLLQNSTLQSLDLASNFIGEEGGLSLSKAFAKNSGLKCVDIRCNKFPKPVIEKISMAWESNKHLETLRLFNFSSRNPNGTLGSDETDTQYSDSQDTSATILRPGSEPSFASTALSEGWSHHGGASSTGASSGSKRTGNSWNRIVEIASGKKKSQRASSASSNQLSAEASKKRSSLRALVGVTQGLEGQSGMRHRSKDSSLWRRRKLKEVAKFGM